MESVPKNDNYNFTIKNKFQKYPNELRSQNFGIQIMQMKVTKNKTDSQLELFQIK